MQLLTGFCLFVVEHVLNLLHLYYSQQLCGTKSAAVQQVAGIVVSEWGSMMVNWEPVKAEMAQINDMDGGFSFCEFILSTMPFKMLKPLRTWCDMPT